MRTFNNRTSKGYTLLETVVYTAILSMIVISVFDTLFSLTKSFVRARAFNEVKVSGATAMDRMIRETRTAASANLSLYPGDLYLNTTDTDGNAKTIHFHLDGTSDTVNIIDDLVDKGPLTGSGVEVTALSFTNASTSKGALVKMSMTVRSKKIPSVEAKFSDSAVLRGAY